MRPSLISGCHAIEHGVVVSGMEVVMVVVVLVVMMRKKMVEVYVYVYLSFKGASTSQVIGARNE